jgi:hypothetical protein
LSLNFSLEIDNPFMQDTFAVSHVLIAQGRRDLTKTRRLMLPELKVGLVVLDDASNWPAAIGCVRRDPNRKAHEEF